MADCAEVKRNLPVVVDCTALMLEIQYVKEYSYALYKRNIKEKQHMGIGLHWTRYISVSYTHLVAGFLAGWMKSHDYKEAFRMGVACGSASAFSEYLADSEMIEKVYNQVQVMECK